MRTTPSGSPILNSLNKMKLKTRQKFKSGHYPENPDDFNKIEKTTALDNGYNTVTDTD